MNITIATTREEFNLQLKDIFHEYRLRKDLIQQVALEDLALERMEYTPRTEEQLFADAQLLLDAEREEKYLTEQNKIQASISSLQAKNLALNQAQTQRMETINAQHEQAVDNLRKQAIKNGGGLNDILNLKIFNAEQERDEKIEQITAQTNLEINANLSEIEMLNTQLTQLPDLIDGVFEKKVQAKILELRIKDQETAREVFKYNNSLDEKEQRNKNSNKTANANIQMTYLEMISTEYSKDELINSGYYDVMIEAVCGFYDSFYSDAILAYEAFTEDKVVMLYLDHFYTTVLELYRAKAGL